MSSHEEPPAERDDLAPRQMGAASEAANVSVTGDSADGNIALAAVRYMGHCLPAEVA